MNRDAVSGFISKAIISAKVPKVVSSFDYFIKKILINYSKLEQYQDL